MQDRTPLIELHDVAICNGDASVIHNLQMDIMSGDFVYLIGKVGSGKTSIIRTIIAENPLTEGKGRVCGYDLRYMREGDIPMLRRSLGVVFQDFQLLMDRNVHDNLEFVLKSTGWKDKVAIEDRIKEVLAAVGMETKAHKMPFQMSGGEQQRIAIARSLLNKPRLILADEPTGNLDAETADDIMNLLRSINQAGTAIVMVTHNNAMLEKYPGRVYICESGKCIEKK